VQTNKSKSGPRWLGLLALLAVIVGAGILTFHAARNWSATAKARKLKNPYPSTGDAIAAGMQVYTHHCRSCHGQYGVGKGEKAGELSVAPGDFTNARKMGGLADGELYWQITRGRLPMPAFADKLNEQERWQVVDYIRTFAEKPPGSTAAPAESPRQP